MKRERASHVVAVGAALYERGGAANGERRADRGGAAGAAAPAPRARPRPIARIASNTPVPAAPSGTIPGCSTSAPSS